MTFVDLMQTIQTLSIEKLEETASYLKKEIGADDPVASEDSSLIPALTTSVADLSEIERQVLFFAGFLPEAGLERDVFEHSLTLEQKKSVPNLINRGALYLAKTLLCVHPDIRSSIPNIIPAPNHITYFDLLWEFENSRHWDRISMKRENAVHQALAHIFSAAAERFPESALTYSLRSAELWAKAITLIQYDLTADLGLKTIAQKLNVNSSYLSTLFRTECGCTLTEYVTRERIDRGIYLLQRTEKSVQEIAAECGIQDANYFIKLFKKLTGLTPGRYREQMGTYK